MTPLERIRELKHLADAAIASPHNQASLLPFSAEAIQIISAHPELREAIQDLFLERPLSWEFVSFCAHCLRWPSLKEHVEAMRGEAIANNDWRAEPCFRHILEAFEDNWEDAQDIYPSYFFPNAT